MSEWDIQGDLHVHAHHTACDQHKPGDPVEYDNPHCGKQAVAEMEAYLATKRFSYAGVVNHATDPVHPAPPSKDSEAHITLHRRAIQEINGKTADDRLTLLAGVEASLLPDGSLDVTHETLCALDFTILSRHGGTTDWPVPRVVKTLRPLFRSEPIHILGHPTRYSPAESLEGIEAIFALCAEEGVAVELNAANPFGRERIANIIESGALIALGSDIHLNMLGDARFKRNIRGIPVLRELEEIGMQPERIVNTWPLDELRAWLETRHAICAAGTHEKI
jgi:histidinol phosphatase-like PHP family hydrolase